MTGLALRAGLTPPFATPPETVRGPVDAVTEEAGVVSPPGPSLRVQPLVEQGQLVAQGAPVAALADRPEIQLVAPMAGRVARVALGPGKTLGEIVLFRESGGDRHRFTAQEDVRDLAQAAGLWPRICRRPFGGMPRPDERPSGIVVMAVDTRPHAPDPVAALTGREDAFARGLDALSTLTDGPVHLCLPQGADLPTGTARVLTCGPRHPQGLPGHQVHRHWPATLDAPVWDIHAEDVADLGDLIETGHVPETRLVRVAGDALRETRLVRTQPGADLRGLTHAHLEPGAHRLLSGSPLDGVQAYWLGPRDRQVSALTRPTPAPDQHWFVKALTRSALPRPVIPTSALRHAMGGDMPAAPLARALAAGDDETAMDLGVLCYLEEDLALADYVTGDGAHLRQLLRRMLDRIATEYAA